MLNANFIKIGLICVLGLAACGEERSEDPAAQSTQPTIEEASTKPADLSLIGTFISESSRPGALAQLVLKTNGTFHSATMMECIAPPCAPFQEDGLYRISERDARWYITLYRTDGPVLARYQYQWRDDTLRLLKVSPVSHAVPETDWLSMWLSTTAWCGNATLIGSNGSASNDCALQNLPIGPCAGRWVCVSNMCSWDCAVPR